jgi:hypothetical protein
MMLPVEDEPDAYDDHDDRRQQVPKRLHGQVVGAQMVISEATMAIDHLIGTKSERDESQYAEPNAFVITAEPRGQVLQCAIGHVRNRRWSVTDAAMQDLTPIGPGA